MADGTVNMEEGTGQGFQVGPKDSVAREGIEVLKAKIEEIEDTAVSSGDFIDVLAKTNSLETELGKKASAASVNTLTSQLAETGTKIQLINSFLKKGKLWYPPNFPTHKLLFNLYRDSDGKIKHDYNINSFTGVEIFVKESGGLDTNDGLSEAKPVKTFQKALDIASARVENNVIINILSRYLTRNISIVSNGTINKNIKIRAKNEFGEAIFTSAQDSPTWTQDGVAYKTTRSTTAGIVDLTIRDYRGMPLLLKKVNSIAEVQSEVGTWYTDGTDVWIRRTNGEAPDANILLSLTLGSLQFNIQGKTLILENIKFIRPSLTAQSLYVIGDESSILITHKCGFAGGGANGLSASKVGRVFSFESTAMSNGADGFNYHGTLIANPYEFAFEYDCHGYDNGFNVVGTGNATTAHEGMAILRVGSVGYLSNGPVLADVNGCKSVCYDCTMYDSIRATNKTKAAFYFDEADAVNRGYAYLINCSGGGTDTFSVNSDGNISVYIGQGFKGNQIPNTQTINYI